MPTRNPEERVLIIAPAGQDAAAMAGLIEEHGFEAVVCAGPTAACEQLRQGAGALVLTEETLESPQIPDLFEQLRAQPPWSEVPVTILTSGGEPRLVTLLDLAARAAGSVTLLERPLRTVTLLRALEVCLSSRRRQYQVRDLLEEQRRKQRELMRTQEQLKRTQAELEQHASNLEKTVAERTHDLRTSNEQLEAFVYSIAHDLRAPLRSMTGYSQLLLDDYAPRLDEPVATLLKRIQGSSEFMDKLLLDLLAYGRAARSEIKLGPVNLGKAWEIAEYQCASPIEQRHAHVDVAKPMPTVLAHEATLGQCLANLLSNALKFVAPNEQPRIRCWVEPRGPCSRVWVEDNGIGIPADQHERIFGVFERLHGARYGGTGIGLSIVRKGIERMGGKVGVESEPGKGSRFWIELVTVE